MVHDSRIRFLEDMGWEWHSGLRKVSHPIHTSDEVVSVDKAMEIQGKYDPGSCDEFNLLDSNTKVLAAHENWLDGE